MELDSLYDKHSGVEADQDTDGSSSQTYRDSDMRQRILVRWMFEIRRDAWGRFQCRSIEDLLLFRWRKERNLIKRHGGGGEQSMLADSTMRNEV